MSPSILIKVTVPKEILNVQRVEESIKNIMHSKTAPDLQKYFRSTVDGWEKKPDFSKSFSFSSSHLATSVFASGTGADIYALVNAGSPKHRIPVRRARTLRFQIGYRASTSPRILSSRANSRFGDFYTPLVVNHPGFKAREFDETIAEEYSPIFESDIQDAIDRGSR